VTTPNYMHAILWVVGLRLESNLVKCYVIHSIQVVYFVSISK